MRKKPSSAIRSVASSLEEGRARVISLWSTSHSWRANIRDVRSYSTLNPEYIKVIFLLIRLVVRNVGDWFLFLKDC